MKEAAETAIIGEPSTGRAVRLSSRLFLSLVVGLAFSSTACVKKPEPPGADPAAPPPSEDAAARPDSFEVRAARLAGKPMPPEQAKELLGDLAGNWFYGRGIGETALSAGAIVMFPPYALYLLGNSVLSMSGYEPIYITDALPEEERRAFDSVYADLTSAPGRLNAALAGKEFRTEERVDESLKKYTNAVQ